jgi:hypothetical protein
LPSSLSGATVLSAAATERMPSIFWASAAVPSVATQIACVSPRVNSALPCVRGSRLARLVMGRIAATPRPSARRPSRSTRPRMTDDSTALNAICSWGAAGWGGDGGGGL